MADIRTGFFAECEELLERLMDALGDPGLDDPNGAAIHQAFRAVHTIKGGAASLGFSQLADHAHDFETRLDLIRAGDQTLSTDDLLSFLRTADRLADHVAAAAGPPSPPDDAPDPRWSVVFHPSGALYASGNEPLHILNALAELGDAEVRCDLSALPALADLDPEAGYLRWHVGLPGTVPGPSIRETFDFVEDLCDLSIISNGGGEPAPPPADAPLLPPQTGVATVRVGLDRIDRLMNLVGELVIGQSMLSSALAHTGQTRHSPAMTALEGLGSLTRDLQDAVMAIRAQPIKPLFQRMERILREAAGRLGKSARLTCQGETTEVDRVLIERLAEPLTHMIRNAVDHGLEAPTDRRATGKPETGEVRLLAANRSGRVVIEIADDGAGIDRTRVRDIAVERGLIAADHLLTDAETDALLFRPGFSTARELTALSGRGVGMDTVRAALSALGGRITIASAPGQGTRFTLSLPLTLAVLDGLLVRVGDQTLVIPLAATLETAQIDPADLKAQADSPPLVRLRDRHVALCDAGSLFGLARPDPSGLPRSIAVLIADEDDRRIALLVDDILDQTQVVIKDLRGNCGPVPGIAAATILGDGKVALIVDPGDLIDLATTTLPSDRPRPGQQAQ